MTDIKDKTDRASSVPESVRHEAQIKVNKAFDSRQIDAIKQNKVKHYLGNKEIKGHVTVTSSTITLQWKAPFGLNYERTYKMIDTKTNKCILSGTLTERHHPAGEMPGPRVYISGISFKGKFLQSHNTYPVNPSRARLQILLDMSFWIYVDGGGDSKYFSVKINGKADKRLLHGTKFDDTKLNWKQYGVINNLDPSRVRTYSDLLNILPGKKIVIEGSVAPNGTVTDRIIIDRSNISKYTGVSVNAAIPDINGKQLSEAHMMCMAGETWNGSKITYPRPFPSAMVLSYYSK